MKQGEINSMMLEINKKCKFPKYWNDFIEKQIEKYHYIIKDTKNKECYCTNCHHTFYDTKVRIRHYFKCPNCNKEIYVISKNAKYMPSFKQSVNLVQRFSKNIITRVFEIEVFYNQETKCMEKDIVEYCRIIPGKGKFLGDNVRFFLGYMHIYHYDYITADLYWREYDGVRFFSDFPAYPYNKKKIVKGTKFEYAPIKDFTIMFYPYNFIDTLQLAAYESFELLWNMKLYNLCFSSKKLNKNGSFYKRFGLPKNYLKFMQDKNIDYRCLKLLQILKVQDINLIKKCYDSSFRNVKFLYKNGILENYLASGNNIYLGNIKVLKEISEFIPLKKLNNYPKGLNNLNIYKDYLVMSEKLALNYVSKKDLFPRNLISRHDKMQKKLAIEEDRETHFKAYLRYLELSKYTYEDEKYIIFPAPSIEDLKDEGKQQGNCVGYMYLNPYIESKTEIYFIRNLSESNKSFITLEFKNGNVVQKELPHHSRKFTDEQNDFIDKWIGYRSFIEQKEKYKKKQEIKVIKYNFKKMAA